MHACDVLVFGDYFCDIIITGLPEPPRLGADLFGDHLEIAPGGAYILAAALHRLGVHVRWNTRVGNDLFSRFVYEEAVREGLDTSLFEFFEHPLRSMSVSFSFVHDRGFISYTDIFPEHEPETIISAQKPRWVVNAPFDGSDRSRSVIELIHRQGGRVYIDCQYTTSTLEESGLTDTLCMTDIFAPNQSEAAQLTGESDPQKAAARLAEFCPLVIVKCGAQGAYARAGEKVWHSPAIPVKVLDTTGAGDAFNAGFLAAYLQGEPVETCLHYGNICGGLSTTQCGGANAVPTLEQLKQYL
jgi:sugar/nucleoside kinase (ribokinase family)